MTVKPMETFGHLFTDNDGNTAKFVIMVSNGTNGKKRDIYGYAGSTAEEDNLILSNIEFISDWVKKGT